MSAYAGILLAASLALSSTVPSPGNVAPERNAPTSAVAERPLIVAQYDPCANGACAQK